MKRITYKTQNGKIVFGGGTYMLTSVDGLNNPEVQRQAESVIDTDGQTIVQTYYPSKTITINGYIRAQNEQEVESRKRDLIRICDCKTDGKLFYESEWKRYFTEVIPEAFPEFGDKIQYTLPFSISFSAYAIYWKKSAETAANVYERIPNVWTKFTLPRIFTIRNTKKTFYNYGDLPCDFICEITGVNESGELVAKAMSSENQTGFELINNSTGERLLIEHDVAIGETVRIDTENFSITSNTNGNLLHKMRHGCDFFRLEPGKSEIEVINRNVQNNISVHFQFHETYLGV